VKIIGVGGAGCNIVNRLILENHCDNNNTVAVETNSNVWWYSFAETKVFIGEGIVEGAGAASPEIGRQAAERDIEKICDTFRFDDIVLLAAGLGGGTSTSGFPNRPTVITEEKLFSLLQDNAHAYAISIQGKSGSGKTRLIQRISSDFKKVKVLSDEQMSQIIVDDIRDDTDKRRASLFGCRILAVEDVDLLRGKPTTQEEYARLFNELLNAGVHVIVTGIHLNRRVRSLIAGIEKEKLLWIDL
jgi:ribosomal protein S6E (S10)